MVRSAMTSVEVAERGEALYWQGIRERVETPENIGKMVVIDIKTGEYEVDELGIKSARKLHARRPDAALYGIRVGYNVAESLSGTMERIAQWKSTI